MDTVNSVSGGKTSAFIAAKYPAKHNVFSLVCINDPESKPKDKSIVQYVNGKLGDRYIKEFGEFIATAEDDQTLYAMRELEQFIGKEITWVRGKDLDDIIDIPGHKGVRTRLPGKLFRYCTEEAKMLAIFMWWFENVGEKVKMNIGFRFDEFDRLENFYNSRPNEFRIPVACSTRGQRLQRWESFIWRQCSFPAVKSGVIQADVANYWRGKILFPDVSNCVGCFHKKPETLCVMAAMHRSKMEWFARQEHKGKGTWLQGTTYDQILTSSDWTPEMIRIGSTCDSGGCTD